MEDFFRGISQGCGCVFGVIIGLIILIAIILA